MEKPGPGRVSEILKTVRCTIDQYQMIQPGDRVLAGVSGGPDSVALVHILKALAETLSIDLAVAHLNHELRGEASDQDEAFTEDLARRLDLPFFVEKAEVDRYARDQGLSLEHAARRVRYEFFRRTAQTRGYSKVALGHHGDDNAEVVLMALIRGSGPRGLAGIPPVRDGWIIRPLFHLHRSQILNWLQTNRIDCVVDETNLDPRYLRNKIRLELIPRLQREYNPRITEALNRLSDILGYENLNRERETESSLEDFIHPGPEKTLALDIQALNQLTLAGKRTMVREAVARAKGDLKKITLAHVNALLALAESSRTFSRLDLPDRLLVRRKGDRLFFSKEEQPLRSIQPKEEETPPQAYEYAIHGPGDLYLSEIQAVVSISEMDTPSEVEMGSAGQAFAFFDINKLNYPLILRNSRPDDCFVPLGASGPRSVRKFLKNQGVSQNMRRNHPVMVSNGTIIWIPGKRVDESVKVGNQTHRVLRAHFRSYP